MSEFQKLTLKRYGRNFLILYGLGALGYGMVESEFIRYAALALLVGTIVSVIAYGLIRVARWDWWLRGKLNKDEYEAYQSCDRMFGWRDDKYLPTKEQIMFMANDTSIDAETLWRMFYKLTEEVEE